MDSGQFRYLKFHEKWLKFHADILFEATINAVKVVLPSLNVQMISKMAQDLLSCLQAIYDKSFDSIASSIIDCVTVLLQSLFGASSQG